MDINEVIADDAAIYAKMVRTGKDSWRVETKHAEDLDDWPTDHGEHSAETAAVMILNNGWTPVNSWQEALKLEGWTKPWPRTTLFAPAV